MSVCSQAHELEFLARTAINYKRMNSDVDSSVGHKSLTDAPFPVSHAFMTGSSNGSFAILPLSSHDAEADQALIDDKSSPIN